MPKGIPHAQEQFRLHIQSVMRGKQPLHRQLRDRFERVIAEIEKQLSEIEEKIAADDNRRELIEQYTALEHLTREIVETLIDYIFIDKRIPGTKDVPIEIHWNF